MQPNYVIPQIDWPVVMPTVVLFITGVVALLIEMLRPKQNNNLIVGVSLVGLGYAFYLLLNQLGLAPTTTMSGLVTRDQFAVLAQLIIVGATAVSFMFSEGYLRNKRIAYGEFYPLAIWAAAGAMIMSATESMIMLFIGLEVLSIALYCLAGMSRDEQKSEESALKYFLLGAFASAILLFGIAFVYGSSGTTNMDAFQIALQAGNPQLLPLAVFGLTMIIIGLGFKAGLVPFHQWTPDVYQGAPSNVTGFMAAVVKVAAFAALYRILVHAVDLQEYWFTLAAILAVLTMTVGNLFAMVQKDFKRLLGFSSVAHAGYLLVGLLAYLRNPETNTLGPVVFYLIAYSLMTIGSFAIVTVTAKDGKDGSRMSDLNGLWSRAPLAAICLVVFMVSLIGIPPTGGFFGKYQIFWAALQADMAPLAIALAINSVISTYYYWQVIRAAFVDDETVWTRKLSPMGTGLTISCVVCVVGLFWVVFSPGLQNTIATSGIDNGVERLEREAQTTLNEEPDVPVIISPPEPPPAPAGGGTGGGPGAGSAMDNAATRPTEGVNPDGSKSNDLKRSEMLELQRRQSGQ